MKMNDETFEIETSASEAENSEIAETSEELSSDTPFVDTQAEISDPEAEAESEDAPEEALGDLESDNKDERMSEEIESLRRELEGMREKRTALISEIREFSELFGADALSHVPDSVWESTSGGVPLAAAYALYEKKLAKQRELAECVNQKNAAMSAGAVKNAAYVGFYSPEEVRAMSAKEVKKNYNLIIESMKKWN